MEPRWDGDRDPALMVWPANNFNYLGANYPMQKLCFILLATLALLSCSRSNPSPSPAPSPVPIPPLAKPALTTRLITNITMTTAAGGGSVSSDNGAPVTDRGIEWATNSNFTGLQRASSGTGLGDFTIGMTGLTPGTLYYVRAFATNSQGIGYGADFTFKTTPSSGDSNYLVSTYAITPDANQAPEGVAVDPSGIVYTCAPEGKIYKITPNGTLSTFATLPPYLIDLVTDVAGNVYVAAVGSVLKISPAGNVTTFAGGVTGQVDGLGRAAGFRYACSIDIDNTGTLYVADLNSIRKIDPTGRVSTLFSRIAPDENFFSALAVDKNHNVYFAASKDSIIRLDTQGVTTYIAGNFGSSDGTGNAARFMGIYCMRFTKEGTLLAADLNKVRRITPSGVVTTLAGLDNYGDVDGNGAVASFNNAVGLSIDSGGNIFVADAANFKIRKISHK
jgi:hypothetical protein